MEYNFREIEKKWQQRWAENHTYQVTEDESKKKFYVLQSDADTLPAEMKGIYTGDEFPEYKGAETITFNNKTYINGLDYQTVKSGKHVRIEECPICNRLSIIYARGVCKACAMEA